jgi:hypothetical protein
MLVVAKDLQTQYEKALDRLARHETRNSLQNHHVRQALPLFAQKIEVKVLGQRRRRPDFM